MGTIPPIIPNPAGYGICGFPGAGALVPGAGALFQLTAGARVPCRPT